MKIVCGQWQTMLTIVAMCIFDDHDQLIRKLGHQEVTMGNLIILVHGLAFNANNHLHVVKLYNHRERKFDAIGGSLASMDLVMVN